MFKEKKKHTAADDATAVATTKVGFPLLGWLGLTTAALFPLWERMGRKGQLKLC